MSAPEAWELTQEYEEKGKRLTEKEEHRLKKLGNILGDVLVSLKQQQFQICPVRPRTQGIKKVFFVEKAQ